MQVSENHEMVTIPPRVFTGHPVGLQRVKITPKPLSITLPLWVGLVGIAAIALILRIAQLAQQSPYMDETTYVLTGRLLIEKHISYLGYAYWAYGSYLWALGAGIADMVGGLVAVRSLNAALTVVTVVATGLAAYRLAADKFTHTRRWLIAIIAAGIMAVFPTAIGLGRFATYDALAAAGFMLGLALLAPFPAQPKRVTLLVAAGLMFVGFLSKYIVAAYFPFLCLFLLFGPRTRTAFWRSGFFFVLPLAAGCAAYFYLFRTELTTLLSFSASYTDLKSDNPLREYVWQRPELWVLLALAIFGFRRATGNGRVVAVGGTAIILAFQAASRPDFDFWKHSIYVIFFLAPLAALVLAPIAEFGLRWVRLSQWRQRSGRSLAIFVTGATALIAGVGMFLSLQAADTLVTFYPNVTDSVGAIKANTAAAKNVLVDDTAIRFYLYPHIQPQQVNDPFTLDYKGLHDIPAYTQAITDRYYDTIILDGGIGPVGSRIRNQLGDLIDHYYDITYSAQAGSEAVLEIYRPRTGQIAPMPTAAQDTNGAKTYNFTGSVHSWGSHPDNGNLQPGFQVSISHDQLWQNQTTLQFKPTDSDAFVGVKRTAAVSQIKVQIYVANNSAQGTVPLHLGMVGFDSNWQWHDDGFKQTVPVGKWTELTWTLPQPGIYNEIGLKFQDATGRTIYIGQVEVQP